MTLESERLISLLDFARESVLLRRTPPASITQHNIFSLFEDAVLEQPGLDLDSLEDDDNEIWLSVQRLSEVPPPPTDNSVLAPWVQIDSSPTKRPVLLAYVEASKLADYLPDTGMVTIDDYPRSEEVQSLYRDYVAGPWAAWSELEKPRRDTIALYGRLFTLKQRLEDGLEESALELVWGIGIALLQGAQNLSYPIVTQLVELTLNETTAALEIRPRDVEPELELSWFAAQNNPAVAEVERRAGEFLKDTSEDREAFSPFKPSTFEPALRSAAALLDAGGTYWPDIAGDNEKRLPSADRTLKITGSWVVFARPRTNNAFLQDLRRLRASVEEGSGPLPSALSSVVTEPSGDNTPLQLPSFRGVTATYQSEITPQVHPQELYFPKPFNEEQVRIIQLLEVANGVVVQGPPGTGKTHTIANVICHYLAHGKRVLVTSMKDPALAVLQKQLPEEIRPLAISLLTGERDGMKQFEHSINKIASDIQSIDREREQRDITALEETIDNLHRRLASIDHTIEDWARRNLDFINIDGREINPVDAAREVVEHAETIDWLTDNITVAPEHAPPLSDVDIVHLREARKVLGSDIDYLDIVLPDAAILPDPAKLLELHQSLSTLQRLTGTVQSGQVPELAKSPRSSALLNSCSQDLQRLRRIRDSITRGLRSWTEPTLQRLRAATDNVSRQHLDSLSAEVKNLAEQRQRFLDRPVELPTGGEFDVDYVAAVERLAAGRNPFGLGGFLGRKRTKSLVSQTQVLGLPAQTPEDWAQVHAYLQYLTGLRQAAVRWQAFAPQLGIETSAADGVLAIQEFNHYRLLRAAASTEKQLAANLRTLFPGWAGTLATTHDDAELDTIEQVLTHHQNMEKLAQVWVTREEILRPLDSHQGRIADQIRVFLREAIGSVDREDDEIQAQWSEILDELRRIRNLATQLTIVKAACTAITGAGAPRYADALRRRLEGPADVLLPDNWRQIWDLRRLATHLDAIDPRNRLTLLGRERRDVEAQLARSYSNLIVKRTWLKLTENATDGIRAALQAYLIAIRSIGRGTGKRAVRYRQDARNAAALATPAVPCWIMAHHRVSESLPPQLGAFDLVIIDEASQSDLSALPALFRANKILVVGDDKQVSPEGVGIEEEKTRALAARFLANQVEIFRPQMDPARSMYDLFKVVFASKAIMLKEHFRCVNPIIEYSKREFYNHELRPLRVPHSSERIDPPLVDIYVADGYRTGDINRPEARVIVDEIKQLVADPRFAGRSIGVVSLLADKQAIHIWELLTREVGTEIMQTHDIACGDARTFQGKERDIMFLSMVAAPDRATAISRETFAQRFNVAASRARDRMYLVRSLELSHLSPLDVLRRSLINHFSAPFPNDPVRVRDLRELCESDFERDVYDALVERGFRVTPQVKVGPYRIDLVVEGANDRRLAVECDGDKYHGADKWADDMQRQSNLERSGWTFWRSFASAYVRHRPEVLEDLVQTLKENGIEPIGAESVAAPSIHTEKRVIDTSGLNNTIADAEDEDNVDGENGGAVGDHPVDWAAGDLNSPVDSTTEPNETFIGSTPSPLHGSSEVSSPQPLISHTPSTVPEPAPDRSRDDRIHGNSPTSPIDLSDDVSAQATAINAGTIISSISSVSSSSPTPVTVMAPFVAWIPRPLPDPRTASQAELIDAMEEIISAEGPILARRLYQLIVKASGGQRLSKLARSPLNRALVQAVRSGRLLATNPARQQGEIVKIVRLPETPEVRLRQRGDRTLEEVPVDEVAALARHLIRVKGISPNEIKRAILDEYNLVRMTPGVSDYLDLCLQLNL